jgi:hypothetical protein
VWIGLNAATGQDRALTGRKVSARIFNMPFTSMRNLKSNMIGNFRFDSIEI